MFILSLSPMALPKELSPKRQNQQEHSRLTGPPNARHLHSQRERTTTQRRRPRIPSLTNNVNQQSPLAALDSRGPPPGEAAYRLIDRERQLLFDDDFAAV